MSGPRDDAGEAGALSSAENLELEQALVRRAQAGERQALRRLLERHADALFDQVILPRVGDRAVAEDLLRATLLSGLEKLSGFRWQGRSIYFWLRRIAVNKVVDHHRGEARRARMARRLAAEPEPAVLPGRGPEPEEALIAAEERRINQERLERALSRVNPRYRRAVELRLLQERPRAECAEALGVSVATFDVVLHRALSALRKQMGERER